MKERSPKFLTRLKSKKEKVHLQSQYLERHSEIIDIIRVQMQISKAVDSCIRKRLMQLASRKTYGQIDVPQISLWLLSGMSKSNFLNEKLYMQWKMRQVSILEELLYFSNITIEEQCTIKSSLDNIRNAKERDTTTSPSEHAEVLLAIIAVASKFSSVPGQFGIPGETCYWTAGYHLNIRLYEKLLFGVFDILEEGSFILEADEILALFKLTWSTLGITPKLHSALYGWVLFQQFVRTDEAVLLDYAILEVQKVLSTENSDVKEEQYMNSLTCFGIYNDSKIKLSLVQAVFFSMSIWCDSKLKDYHLHFGQKFCNFKGVMTLASAAWFPISGEYGEIKFEKINASNEIAARKLETYVESSIKVAYKRVVDAIDLQSKIEKTHPLALLANELRLITKRELTIFLPVLRHWCPKAGIISAVILHRLYGERLRPFLKGVACLSKDARSVLPAADMLDHDLTQLYASASEENQLNHPFGQDFDHYPIGEVSRSIILDWVIAQHEHILEWTGRAIDLEDWEPLSFQQKQATSVVEVFRMIEETVDQFFSINLPMDITHLQALLSVIFHTLDTYLLKVANQLVEKKHLFPSVPSLTRYTETFIPAVKKKSVECTLLDEKVSNKLNELTLPKLCVRLNTVQYIQKKIGTLEDGVRNSWALIKPSVNQIWSSEKHPETLGIASSMSSECVDELFITTFNSIRDFTADIICKLCDFTGARVVFWDLRDSFLCHLYRGNVESARLDSILSHVDTVLDHVCGLIVDTLRDLVVLSIFRASLVGYVWVLLDGGPTRAFSASDIVMIEDDLNILKEFFIANGDGLPRSLVEQEAKFAQQILGLFSLQTETIIQMLMSASKHISTELDSHTHDHRSLESAHTLIRVLCHKKDREASKFLKSQYRLPMSSEYEDTPSKELNFRSPVISDILKRTTSFHLTANGQSSFRSIKKKFQEATSEIRHAAW
ncbi:protein unc-13 homolog isoform X2 [Malania oleifera]|nr:protein unc-13 homolog isoform X2 [Malania oleifera]